MSVQHSLRRKLWQAIDLHTEEPWMVSAIRGCIDCNVRCLTRRLLCCHSRNISDRSDLRPRKSGASTEDFMHGADAVADINSSLKAAPQRHWSHRTLYRSHHGPQQRRDSLTSSTHSLRCGLQLQTSQLNSRLLIIEAESAPKRASSVYSGCACILVYLAVLAGPEHDQFVVVFLFDLVP